jgi:isocitrate/isopropylmalate dehydrogenase
VCLLGSSVCVIGSRCSPQRHKTQRAQRQEHKTNQSINLKIGLLYTPINPLGHVSWNGMVRKDLDVYASTTLIRNLPGNWPVRHNNVDFAIIRENTEGEYSGKEHSVRVSLSLSLALFHTFLFTAIDASLSIPISCIDPLSMLISSLFQE